MSVPKFTYGCHCVAWKLFNCVSLDMSVSECCHCVSETVCRMDTVCLTVCQYTFVSVDSRLSVYRMDRLWVCPTVWSVHYVYLSSVTVVAVSHENCTTVCRWTSSVTVVAVNIGVSHYCHCVSETVCRMDRVWVCPTASVYISVPKFTYGCHCVAWKLFNCVSLDMSVSECCHCVSETVCRMDTVCLTVCQYTLLSVDSRLSVCRMDSLSLSNCVSVYLIITDG